MKPVPDSQVLVWHSNTRNHANRLPSSSTPQVLRVTGARHSQVWLQYTRVCHIARAKWGSHGYGELKFRPPPSCENAGHILTAYLWLQSSTFNMEWNFWRNVGYSQILVKSVFFNIPWLLINIAVVGVSPNTSICFMTTFTIGSNTQWLLFLWFVVNTRNRAYFLLTDLFSCVIEFVYNFSLYLRVTG